MVVMMTPVLVRGMITVLAGGMIRVIVPFVVMRLFRQKIRVDIELGIEIEAAQVKYLA